LSSSAPPPPFGSSGIVIKRRYKSPFRDRQDTRGLSCAIPNEAVPVWSTEYDADDTSAYPVRLSSDADVSNWSLGSSPTFPPPPMPPPPNEVRSSALTPPPTCRRYHLFSRNFTVTSNLSAEEEEEEEEYEEDGEGIPRRTLTAS